ncbi:MAG: hypothetical protein OER56_06415 [Hyphomicrobiales bacterium]|nr:hypothetical protein [Hyphomicrobiales bacterium]
MALKQRDRSSCRIVIGLKAASDIDPPVDAATVLASAIKAELVGLFIEEEAMMDLASLPFASAISFGASKPQPLTPDTMKQAIARGAMMCQRALSTRATSARIKWSFSRQPGSAPETVRAALNAGDYLVVSGQNHGFGSYELMDELRSVPKHSSGVLIAARQHQRQTKGPVIAVDDGDITGEKTLALAARVAAATGQQLMLFAVAGTDADADRIIQRAHELTGPAANIEAHRFLPNAPRSIAAGLMHFMPSFVVADLEGEPFGNDRTALDLLRATKAPVVLIRADEGDDQ